MAEVGGRRSAVGRVYSWYLVGLLWFCGFFNYADRMAVNAVYPALKQEFGLSGFQLGLVGSSFMIVYGLTAPFAGYLVDRVSRRWLIAAGLAFWSVICALTATARSFGQLLFYRASEGLGESFYFPASMTIVADYHPPTSRSRAMSVHQTSVYIGTAGGLAVAGYLAEHFGWRSPFYVLGGIGTIYAIFLATQIIEPVRGKSDAKPVSSNPYDAPPDEEIAVPSRGLGRDLLEIVSTPVALTLMLVFVGANYVATAFMTWLPSFIGERFSLGIGASSLTSTTWSLASLVGVLVGGVVADRAAERKGGRIAVQSAALVAASPLILASAWASSVGWVIGTLIGVGFFKGVYDASIFASLFDYVRPGVRGTAAGLMNTVGWSGGALAPIVIGLLSDRYGLSAAIAATAPVYLLAGVLALVASWLARRAK